MSELTKLFDDFAAALKPLFKDEEPQGDKHMLKCGHIVYHPGDHCEYCEDSKRNHEHVKPCGCGIFDKEEPSTFSEPANFDLDDDEVKSVKYHRNWILVEGENTILKKRITNQRRELKRLNKIQNVLRDKLDLSIHDQAELDQQYHEVAPFRQSFYTQRDLNHELRERLEIAESELNELRTQNQRLQEKNGILLVRNQHLNAQVEALDQDVAYYFEKEQKRKEKKNAKN